MTTTMDEDVFVNELVSDLFAEEYKIIKKQTDSFVPVFFKQKKIMERTDLAISVSCRNELIESPSFKAHRQYLPYELHLHELLLKMLYLDLTNEDRELCIMSQHICIYQANTMVYVADLLHNDSVCPTNFLAKYNETTMEMYENKWAISQAFIDVDSSSMKENYNNVRQVCELMRNPEPKKTRRGGKKH